MEQANVNKSHAEKAFQMPKNLYIPPEALEVFLATFEGPLDLLLYLIKKQNINILDIPVAEITEQYMTYIDLMQEFKLYLAAEYLVMAATLTEIKSRLLLPRSTIESDEESTDPRALLIERLQAYEQFRKAANKLDQLPRLGRDLFLPKIVTTNLKVTKPKPNISINDLFSTLQTIIQRSELNINHTITREQISLETKINLITNKLKQSKRLKFSELFQKHDNRLSIVVTFMAMLELLKVKTISLIQSSPFSPIYLKYV